MTPELTHVVEVFLSTPSARRATIIARAVGMTVEISIHALREEGDAPNDLAILCGDRFLSTPSARRATAGRQTGRGIRLISIHALREEGDALVINRDDIEFYFYPRPPRGGRQEHENGI